MTDEAKPKKKKKSQSAIIKDLKERNKQIYEDYRNAWLKLRGAREELRFIKNYLPPNYYKIKFKIKAVNEQIYEYEEISQGYSIGHAIESLKTNKKYPETFELLNVIAFGK